MENPRRPIGGCTAGYKKPTREPSNTLVKAHILDAMHALAALVLLLLLPLAWLAAFALQPRKRWKYRHIPGPFGWPLLGNLPELVLQGQHNFLAKCERRHGPVFKVI